MLTSRLVDTEEGISELVDSIANLPNDPPSLYLDVEGVDLSRHGTISIIQLLVLPENHVYLIDVHTLKDTAFSTPGKNNDHQTLKTILESSDIQKAIFDVRNDSDALYAHFRISLAGIQDIQLMELACRTFSRRLVNGLSKCIENDAMLTAQEKQTWKDVKDRGVKLFSPQHGGSYEVFNQRPLSYLVESYCVQDVQFLPRLWSIYTSRMTTQWRIKVETATRERIILSQSAAYRPKGPHRALGPW